MLFFYSDSKANKHHSTSDTHRLYLYRKLQMSNCTTKYYIILVINSALHVIHSYEIAEMGQEASNRSKLLPPNCRHLTEDLRLELQSPEITCGESHLQRAIQIVKESIAL